MPHIAIVGSRRRTDRATVDRLVESLPADSTIVSGGAHGPDLWAEQAAILRGFPTVIFRPDLTGANGYGFIVRRYHARNQLIVDHADQLFALVAENRKGGTEDTIKRATRKGIPITLL